ncbi:adenylate kinase family protein [Halorussus gelatinilyticus]|uniref:Putative adenylate kinase n=1 Tax=Halorussus gelatinilyticus TaxID=2937524 RepID=A0A8U0IJ04_9EURY|nr:adenylate kinase family protein [Halorussus gelatinilyticus]UPW00059.1 adenylate kinase family protein [Halorussus gelatinilyticus]
MRVAVTGTPGTGKTSAVEALETELEVVHLNDLIRDEDLWEERDEERDSLVADLDAIAERLDGCEDLLVESHLAHHLDADRVVVLRCHPEELERRLTERGESEAKAEENAESEALDVILSEAVNAHGVENVYEIETTDRDPDEVAEEIRAVVAGEREPSAGDVSYIEYI